MKQIKMTINTYTRGQLPPHVIKSKDSLHSGIKWGYMKPHRTPHFKTVMLEEENLATPPISPKEERRQEKAPHMLSVF